MDDDAGIGALENSDTFRDDDYTRSEVFSFTAGVDYRINDDFNQTELNQRTVLAGMNHNLLYGAELGRQVPHGRWS